MFGCRKNMTTAVVRRLFKPQVCMVIVRNLVRLAQLVQRRTFLHAYNRTAFEMLQTLSKALVKARTDASNATQMFQHMNRNLLKSFRRLKYTLPKNDSDRQPCIPHLDRMLQDFMKDVASSNSMVLSMMSTLVDAQNATVQDSESADQDLELVDSFFKVKSIVSPRSTILRDILKTVMKLHVQLTNASANDVANGNHCRNLIEHYVDQLRLIGSRASSALTLKEHVNNELHSLIRYNRMVRVSFPGTIPGNNLDK
ncbi:hypothetical protein CRM22_001660 [Opisthorchis felineus]|uniref:Uncharacterized protein n=3 Tax=Opisthorchis felineus TaxID=147828 RepID=A0A4S2M9K5_OPIFE|nr:hypothetical protein CRM22_001660 [Opisthorchis felineus]